MNNLRSYPNKSDREDKMTKKCLKDLKVTIYTTKVHILLRWLNHRTTWLSVLYSKQFNVGRLVRNFPMMHVNEEKTCLKDYIGLSR